MKFGLFTYPSRPMWLPHVSTEQVFDETLRQAELAEELGFDSFWAGEHHFDEHWATGPNPLTLLAAVAARTHTLQLGTSVVLAALHNPIRLAEEIGLVDTLSHGRLLVGLGSGYLPFEFSGYGVTYDSRRANAWEHIEQLVEALRGGHVTTADGKSLELYPPTIQQPHPPLLYCGYSESSVRRAIRLGLYFMHPGIFSFKFLKVKMDRYHELIREEGFDPADFPHLTNRVGFVDHDGSRAVDVGVTNRQRLADARKPVAEGQEAAAIRPIQEAEAPSLRKAGRDPYTSIVVGGTVTSDVPGTFENLRDEIGIYGTPELAIDKLTQLQDWGVRLVLFSINQQYLEPEHVESCMRLLAKEVLPRFHDDQPLLLPNGAPRARSMA
ncbi:MAG: LLM class flavin-dependent oxidoreductase [Chloroflexota bacterium]